MVTVMFGSSWAARGYPYEVAYAIHRQGQKAAQSLPANAHEESPLPLRGRRRMVMGAVYLHASGVRRTAIRDQRTALPAGHQCRTVSVPAGRARTPDPQIMTGASDLLRKAALPAICRPSTYRVAVAPTSRSANQWDVHVMVIIVTGT